MTQPTTELSKPSALSDERRVVQPDWGYQLQEVPQHGRSLASSIGLCPPQLQNGKPVHAVDLARGKSLDYNPLPEPPSSPFQLDQIKPLGQVQVDDRGV